MTANMWEDNFRWPITESHRQSYLERGMEWDPLTGRWKMSDGSPGQRSRRSHGATDSKRMSSSTRKRRKKALLKRFGPWCYLCGDHETPENPLTLDHRVPRSKGGTDEVDNLALACGYCNQDKGDLTVDEYRKQWINDDLA